MDAFSPPNGVFGYTGIPGMQLSDIPAQFGNVLGGSDPDMIVGSSKASAPDSGGSQVAGAGVLFVIGSSSISLAAQVGLVFSLNPESPFANTLVFCGASINDNLGSDGVSLEILDGDSFPDVIIRSSRFDSDGTQDSGALVVIGSEDLPAPASSDREPFIISFCTPPPGVLFVSGAGVDEKLGDISYQVVNIGPSGEPVLVVRSPKLDSGSSTADVGGVFLIHPIVLNDLSSGKSIPLSADSLEEGTAGFVGVSEYERLGLHEVLFHDFGHGNRLIMRSPRAAIGSWFQVGAVYFLKDSAFAPVTQVGSPTTLSTSNSDASVAAFVASAAGQRLGEVFQAGIVGTSSASVLIMGSSSIDVGSNSDSGAVYVVHSNLIEATMASVLPVEGGSTHPGLTRIFGTTASAELAKDGIQVEDVDGNGGNDLVLHSHKMGHSQLDGPGGDPAGSVVFVHDSLLEPSSETVNVPIDLETPLSGVMVLVGDCPYSGVGYEMLDFTSFATSSLPRFILRASSSSCVNDPSGANVNGAVYIVDARGNGLDFSSSTAAVHYLGYGSLPAGIVGFFGGSPDMELGLEVPLVADLGASPEPDLLLPTIGFSAEDDGQVLYSLGAVALLFDPLLVSESVSTGYIIGPTSMPDGSMLFFATQENEEAGKQVSAFGHSLVIASTYGANLIDLPSSNAWLSSLTVNTPQGDEASTVVEGDQEGQIVARLTALNDGYSSASDVREFDVFSAIDTLNDEGVLDSFTVDSTAAVQTPGSAMLTLSLPGAVDYETLAAAMAGTDAEPVDAALLADLQAGQRPDLDLQLSGRLCDAYFPRTVPIALSVQDAPEPTTVEAFPSGSSDHTIDVTEGEPTANATFDVVLSDGDFMFQADALNTRIVVTSADPMWDPLKDSDDVLQPGSSSLDITIGTPAVVVGSATYTITVGTTSLDYEALASALTDFTTADDPDIVLEFVVQFETSPGVWDAASETATLTLSNAVEPPASVTGPNMPITENTNELFVGGLTFSPVSVWDRLGLSFHTVSFTPSSNTGPAMANGDNSIDPALLQITYSPISDTAADITVAPVDREAVVASRGVDLASATHSESFGYLIYSVVCGAVSCVQSSPHPLIITDVVEPELEIESFPQSLTYTIDEATVGPTTPTVQDFYIRLHDLNRNGNLLDFTLNLVGPSGGPVPEPLQGLTASCGAFTHTTPNAYLEATCSIDTADASFDLEALRVALEGTVTTASPLTGQHYSVEGATGEAPLRVVVSSSIPEQDNAQGPAYDVLVADMDEDPLDLALDEAELSTCFEGADEAQTMIVVPGYDPDFSVETFDGFGTFSVLPDDVTITTSFGSSSLPTLTTTATVTGPLGISNKGTRFNVVIRCDAHLDFEAVLAATPLTAEDGVLSVPTLSHDLTVPLYDYTFVGVIQPITTTVSGGRFGDVNEFPIPSGALRSRAFMLQENSGPGAPLGALTAFHVDAGDSLSNVVVHSASDSLAAVQTSPGVWALQTAPDAVFNFEVPSSSQEGATDSVSSAIVGGTSSAASVAESNQDAADRPERRLPVAFNVHDPCGAVSVSGAATADFSNTDAYMGTNQVPPNVPHAAAPTPPEGSRVVPFCVELTDDGENLAAEGGAKTTLVPAYLYILDRNDPPKLANTNPDPEGEPTYTDHFMLMENADVGIPFGIIRVADEDGDELSSIQVLGMGSEHFEFVHTGTIWRIHAKTSFDFENPPTRSDGSQGSNTWELLVRLTDFRTGGPPASLDFPVTVSIADVNEAPTLDTEHPSATGITVVDTAKAGDVVGTICFADPEERGVAIVSFIDTNFIGTVIPDTPCAEVTLAVDADTFTPLAEGGFGAGQLTFQVTDVGPNDVTVVQHVTVSYVDGNAPLALVRDPNVHPALNEAGGQVVLNIAVVDEEPLIGLTLRVISVRDPSNSPLNAAQFQLLMGAGGALTMLVPNTLAVGAGYTVTVEAEEGGANPNPAVRETTTFEVVDVELPPALDTPAAMLETDQELSFTYTDRDGTPHTFDWIAILRDTTEVERIDGNDLTSSGTGPFTVSLTCTSQCLDLDAGPGQLKVVFMSGGVQLQRDLTVTPVNEERSIAANLVSATITDDAAVGTVVASITFGSDPEQSTALLTGSLSAPAEQDIAWLEVVTVDLTSAEVRVASGLALPEGASEIVDLTLTFTDGAGESISTTLPTLAVQDANAVPVYSGPETLTLSESLPAGGRIVLDLATGVNVQDEEGEEVDSFTLTAATTGAGADVSSAFAVEGAMVKQVGALNWDAPDSITTVQLTGSIVMPSGPPGSVTLLITLTNDPNEFPGQLVDANPAWALQEGEASSITLDVTDADGAPYSIVTPLTGTLTGAGGAQLDVSAHFTASGLTLSTSGLDFEAFQAAPTDATLTLTLDVTVTDGHETLPAAIAVTLSNINEPGMYNHAAALTLAVRENSPAGTVVASLPKSLYSDPEQDALVSVTLAQTSTPVGDSDMFAVEEGVDAFDIVIAPGRHTDYEAHAQYEVVASLHESQFSSSDTAIVHTITFTIMVTDVKKAPFALPADFAASTSTQHRLATLDMAVEENQPLGSVVGAFAVQDPDGDDIASVVLSGDQAAPFIVVSKGDLWQVQTLRKLDTEAQDTYTFAVVMTDSTMRTNLVPVTVTVTDVPEMPTRPGAASLTAPVVWSVPETVAPGGFRRTFATADPDAGQHGQVRLVNAHSMFEIQHGDDGQYSLVNTGTLDFEAGATYSMQTQLVDEGTGALVSTFTTTVNVQDVNEAPTYTGPSTFSVLESAVIGTVVGTLTFADPEGHAVTATLSPASAPFALVATGTGYDLTTAGMLDWESGMTQYTLTLSGQDAGSPAQSVSASLVVNVADVVEATPAATPTRTPVPTPTTTSTAAPTPSATGSPAPVQPSPSVTPSAAASPSSTPVPGVVRQPTDAVCKNARDHTVVGSEAEPNPIVIFAGTSVLTGMEVCKVDAAGSVTLLIDAYPGTAGSNPRNFRKMGPRVCWMSDVSEDSTQFLCYEPSDGVTTLRTLPRRRGRALASGTAPGTFLGASGSLAFFADDLSTPSTGVELYTLDVESSTGAAPALVQDITPGANSTTFTSAATAPDGTFYFTTTTALYRVQVGAGTTASATALVIPRGASVHSTQAVRGAVLVTYTDAAGVAFLRRLDTTTGTVSVAAFEQVSDASTFSTPRHAVAGANGSFFAWRSEGDASVDAVWVFDPSADQELAQVATLPAPAGAPENAVGVVTGLEVSNGRVYVEVASSVGSATGIFVWMGGAWAPITSVEVTAGRVSGSNPAALHAAGAMTLAFTTSDGTFILDTARAAVAAGVVPSPSATPSPSPAAAAAAVATTVEEGDNSSAIGAGVALIAILVVAVGAFMVYRAGVCKRSKKEDKPAQAAAGSADTGATAPSTEQSSAAAAQA